MSRRQIYFQCLNQKHKEDPKIEPFRSEKTEEETKDRRARRKDYQKGLVEEGVRRIYTTPSREVSCSHRPPINFTIYPENGETGEVNPVLVTLRDTF